MRFSLTTCLAAALALIAQASAAPTQAPAVPSNIAIPEGNVLKVTYHAIGTQNYNCTPVDGDENNLRWKLVEPEARLFGSQDTSFANVLGVHYFVPFPDPNNGNVTFMRFDDTSFNINKLSAKALSPEDPVNNIEWLKLQTTSTTDAGVLGKITWVQRINTRGGVAPNQGVCKVLAKVLKVDYEADYLFYTAA